MEDKLCRSCEQIILDDKSLGLEGKGDNGRPRLVVLPAEKQAVKTLPGSTVTVLVAKIYIPNSLA